MIGRSISHYRILGELGSGGMGVVYLAEDQRLGRRVAIKFLPTDAIGDARALERFRVEARAASQLSHPGICAIHDIGDDEGKPFIVMELLKGETLRERIDRGALKLTDVLEIGIQLADALEAAHSQGIIHRDIKPANVFVTEKNRTKILDFGLAKLAPLKAAGANTTRSPERPNRVAPENQITIPGTALGTVCYMSPEQARGEEIDPRSDIFSLGVLLYEMATGHQAFGGSTTAVAFDAILNRTPTPVAHLNPAMPERLESVILTAIEKDPALRYQHAADLQADLRRVRRDVDSGSVHGTSRASVSAAQVSAARSAVSKAATESGRPAWFWPAVVGVFGALAIVAVAIPWMRSQGTVPDAASTPPVRSPSPSQAGTTPPEAPAAATPAPIPETPPAAANQPAPAPVASAPAAAEPATSKPAIETRPRENAAAARSRPPATPPVPSSVPSSRPSTPEPAAQEPPPSVIPAPQPPPPGPPAAAAPVPAPTPPTPAVEPPPAAVVTPPAAVVTPPAPAPAARPIPPPETIKVPSGSEADEASIRSVIATYERAIETKNIDLFRSVFPSLSAADEQRLRDSFRQVDSQEVTIRVTELKISGRTAVARLARSDAILSAGRRQTQSSQQTLQLNKAASGWIISGIGR